MQPTIENQNDERQLNVAAVRAFLLNAYREFERSKTQLLTSGVENTRTWAMDKVNGAELFNAFEPREKVGIASNLVLFVLGKNSAFDSFLQS